ncbi:MAG: S-methyl-5'-thioadenosine phosphorylase [Candidatus Aenigmatarchaeota archaeon]
MIGIIGGSGFYSLLENVEEKDIETPYGRPNSLISIGKISGKDVAFLPRHGKKHEYPPHKIPYKANIYALKKLGVTRIIAPASVGSLKKEIRPGEFLVPDQFVNFTHRDDTFYNENETTHISSAEPFCPELRELLIKTAKDLNLTVHNKGTVVVIQGPRFSTKAESEFYRKNNWDIINMTIYPELILAREMEICYANISIVTDYDAGLKDDPTIKPVTFNEVVRVFNENNEKLKKLIFELIPKILEKRSCICSKALEEARF